MPRSRSRRRRPLLSRLFGVLKILLLILVPCVVWVVVNLGALEEYVAALRDRNKARGEVERLEDEIAALEREASMVERRGLGDEIVARERFQLVKPGEKIVFLEIEPEDSGR